MVDALLRGVSRALVWMCISSLWLWSGCGPSVNLPARGPQPDDAFEPVDFPPPAARPEIIPEPPSDTAVWIDGEWRWRRNRWHWVFGRWTEPPAPDVFFAPSELRYTESGELLHASGRWRHPERGGVQHPSSERLAETTTGDVVEETGIVEDVGPNRRVERPKRRRGRGDIPKCTIDDRCPIDGHDDP